MAEDAFAWLVGIDWASREHVVTVLDVHGGIAGQRVVAHSGAGLQELTDWLLAQSGGHSERVAVAIELSRGPVVESLLSRGFAVFGINPKQLDRFRDRYTMAGAKDDRRDAFVLADTLRTDRARYRRLQLGDPALVALRALVESAEELATELRQQTNRLCALLERYYPQVLALCPGADEAWVWSLLEVAPTPDAAQRVRAVRWTRLLKAHRIRRFDASVLMRTVREPALPLAPGVADAVSGQVRLLIARLRLAHAQRARCEQKIERALAALEADPASDAAIVRSLPGVGASVSAALLVDASALLAARDGGALRSHAGIAPVTRQSGRRKVVVMRRACNDRLRRALYHWSRCSVQRSQRSRAIYAAARARGQSHGRALRGLADRLLRMLIAMLRTRTPYDPARTSAPA